MENEKNVDESWKDSVEHEKEIIFGQEKNTDKEPAGLYVGDSFDENSSEEADSEAMDPADLGAGAEDQINFLNYISSLAFQAMIFMGFIMNPMTNQIDKNLEQAKFIIDTLAMLKEKTQGNLTDQEDKMLSNTVYELQLNYVDVVKKESVSDSTEEKS